MCVWVRVWLIMATIIPAGMSVNNLPHHQAQLNRPDTLSVLHSLKVYLYLCGDGPTTQVRQPLEGSHGLGRSGHPHSPKTDEFKLLPVQKQRLI